MIAWLLVLSIVMAGAGTRADRSTAAEPLRAQQGPKPGSIEGRITAADTGRPLRRARVTFRLATPGSDVRGLAAHTNSLGAFEMKNVPPGSYYVSVARAGYIQIQYGQRHPSEQGLVVEVESGRATKGIDIAVPRGGVIAGRIVDDLGEPYPGVRVDLIAFRYNLGRREPFPASLATTDDRGEFRLSGVQPGRYYLMATSTETWQNDRKETLGYPSTYFPGSAGDRAEVITLGPSEQRTGIVLALNASRAARVSGRVQREDGTPVAGTMVSLSYSYPGAIIVAGGRTARTAADGSFEFREVPGGVYNLSGETVTVSGADVSDIVIVSRAGSPVSGTLVTDDGTPPPFPPSGVRILTEAPTGKVLPALRIVGVEPDWSFRFPSLGGPFLFRVIGLPDGWMLSSVRREGKEITDVPWDVPTGGKSLAPLTISVTRRAGRVSGVVSDSRGTPTPWATVVVFPEDETLWMPYSRYIRSVRPSADGRFSITGLPAGTYRAVAQEYVESGQWEDREWLEQVRDTAVRLVLADGGAERLALRVSSK